VGEGRRHLGDRVAEAEVHDRDHDRRDEEAAEPVGEAELPAEEVARDDRRYAQRPQRPDARVTAKFPFDEVIVIRLAVGDRANFA
jgi:hypothetical protein